MRATGRFPARRCFWSLGFPPRGWRNKTGVLYNAPAGALEPLRGIKQPFCPTTRLSGFLLPFSACAFPLRSKPLPPLCALRAGFSAPPPRSVFTGSLSPLLSGCPSSPTAAARPCSCRSGARVHSAAALSAVTLSRVLTPGAVCGAAGETRLRAEPAAGGVTPL